MSLNQNFHLSNLKKTHPPKRKNNPLSKFFSLLFLLTFFSSCTHHLDEEINKYHIDLKTLHQNKTSLLNSPYVLMISIDGMRYDYIDMYKPPFLSKIQKKGVRAESLESIFPSKTFPNHYTLATGLYADRHGLVANKFYDPQRNESYTIGNNRYTRDGSWYFGEPLWLSVKKQGLLSASYFWVGSDANIKGEYPSYYFPYDHYRPNEKRTKQIIQWLKMPKETRPHFLTLYFSIVDTQGHRFGPQSQQVKESVLQVDKLISAMHREIKKLNLPLNYVIVSDHGMIEISPEKNIFLQDYIQNYSDDLHLEGSGTMVLGYFKKGTSSKRKESLFKALKKIPYTKLYPREKRPQRWHYSKLPRQGDFLLLAEPKAYINTSAPRKIKKGGTHGYDPKDSKEMDGIFLSFGPQIKKRGMIPPIKNIHVYPYIMNLLGLKVKARIDGDSRVLAPLLKQSP